MSTPAIPAARPVKALHADTLAELKALRGRPGQHCVLAGYYAAGDGGGGLFWWDAASTATPDDGLVVQVTGVATGRWRRLFRGAATVAWWGAVPDGATPRHVQFQAALDSGVRRLRVPNNGSSLIIDATLAIGSNTTLDLDPGAVVKLVPGSAMRVMLKNRTYFGASAYAVSITGSTVPTGGTFTLTANRYRTAGIARTATAANVVAALEALPNVGAGNVTVTGAAGGPWVVTFTPAVGAIWLQGYGSGLTGGVNPFVSIARDATNLTDYNIRVRGGEWDASRNNAPCLNAYGNSPGNGNSGLGGIQSYAGVIDLLVEGCEFRGTREYGPSAIQIASSVRFRVADVVLNDLMGDGFHGDGPLTHGVLERVRGSTADDYIALLGADWLFGSQYRGEIYDIVIRNVHATRCGNLLKVGASGPTTAGVGGSTATHPAAPVSRLRIENVGRSDGGNAVHFFRDTDALDPGNVMTVGDITDVTIDGVDCGAFNASLIEVDHRLAKVKLDRLNLDRAAGVSALRVNAGGSVDAATWHNLSTSVATHQLLSAVSVGGTLKSLAIVGGHYYGHTAGVAPIVDVDAGGVVGRVNVSGLQMDAPIGTMFRTAAPVVVNSVTISASWDELNLTDCGAAITSNSNGSIIDDAAGIKRINVRGGRWSGDSATGSSSFLLAHSSAGPIDLCMYGAEFDGLTRVVWNRSVAGITVAQDGCRFLNLGAEIFANSNADPAASGTIALTVRSTNCRQPSGTVFTKYAGINASTYRYLGIDLAQDLTQLAPQQWDTAKSLVAATGPAMFKDGVWNPWGHA